MRLGTLIAVYVLGGGACITGYCIFGAGLDSIAACRSRCDGALPLRTDSVSSSLNSKEEAEAYVFNGRSGGLELNRVADVGNVAYDGCSRAPCCFLTVPVEFSDSSDPDVSGAFS